MTVANDTPNRSLSWYVDAALLTLNEVAGLISGRLPSGRRTRSRDLQEAEFVDLALRAMAANQLAFTRWPDGRGGDPGDSFLVDARAAVTWAETAGFDLPTTIRVAFALPTDDEERAIRDACEDVQGNRSAKRILRAFAELKAFDEPASRNRDDIAGHRMSKGTKAKSYEEAFKLLRKHGLYESKGGPNGGAWLNERGAAVVYRLFGVETTGKFPAVPCRFPVDYPAVPGGNSAAAS